jgi:hypothetical protein
MLTDLIKTIGDEETEPMVVNNEVHMVSKSEAMIRRLWIMANGGTEEYVGADGQVHKREYEPDKKVAELLITRIEGRPAQAAPEGGPERARRAGKFDSGVGNRLGRVMGDDEPEPEPV